VYGGEGAGGELSEHSDRAQWHQARLSQPFDSIFHTECDHISGNVAAMAVYDVKSMSGRVFGLVKGSKTPVSYS
jgi:hypothetical protein